MFLKRLEINGFKSFAGKTIFDFSGAGIICIVGPNGSGKSNVIDAIRWLIGEREAKFLRGEKIEDLIFAGTSKKPKQSLAKVSLVFDNSQGELPFDFKEITISRSINRGGVSQYFINDAEVRLKDIIDFFSKIKLGSRGLSIIGQGEGDIFIKSSPSERMMMIQEILGLKEYQLKKREAERKLKNTKINLEKILAMMEEVLPRLKTLKKQTARWEKRFEIEQELSSLEKNFFAFKIRNLKELAFQIRQPLEKIESQIREVEKEIKEAEKKLEAVENTASTIKEINPIQKRKKEIFSQKSNLEKEFLHLEVELEKASSFRKEEFSVQNLMILIKEVRQKLLLLLEKENLDSLKKEIKELLKFIEENLLEGKEKKEKENIVQLLEQKRKDIVLQIANLDNQLKELEEKENLLSSNLADFNNRFKEAFSYLELLRQKLQNLNKEKQKILFEEEKIAYQLGELKNQIHSFGLNFNDFEILAKSETFDVSFDVEGLKEAERKMLRLRLELSSIGEVDPSLIKEAEEVEAHYNFLSKESQDLLKAIDNLNSLIKELEEKISLEFHSAFNKVNQEFHRFFRIMFGGGQAKMKIVSRSLKVSEFIQDLEERPNFQEMEQKFSEEEKDQNLGIEIEVSIPQKKINGLEMLSGGEKSLVSLAVLFALISVSSPPFLVLDEVDSALDEKNSRRFSELIKNFSSQSQFIIVTHNRITMEAADVLYGVTMDEGGSSKVLSLRLEESNI